ncbi:O-antigen ligase family protein, partial [Patescibacteria group bacterium]
PGTRFLSGLHAYYLTFSVIILLALLLNKKYIFNKVKTFLIFLIQIFGVIGAMFRHLWLGLATVFLLFFSFVNFRQKKNFIKLGLSTILLILIISIFWLWGGSVSGLNNENFLMNNFFTSISNRSQTLFYTGQLTESAVGWRLTTWKIALEKFSTNPFFGIGLGQKFYFEYRGWLDLIDIRNIHNDFAALLVQLGLIGFIPFIMFNFYLIKNLFKKLKKQDDFLVYVLSGFYIVSVFAVFFGIYLMFNGTSIFYWSIAGLIGILTNSE